MNSPSIDTPDSILRILFSIAPKNVEPLPLPDGWEKMETIDGKIVYVDRDTNKVHLDKPIQGKFSKHISF